MLEMKKNFLLLFCFFSITIFSQEYHFDYLIKGRSVRLKPKSQEWLSSSFYDSVKKIKLHIKTDGNNKTIATIYDKYKDVRHVFKVTQSEDKIFFTYVYSNLFNQEGQTKDHNAQDVIKAQKIDSLHYKIIAYKNAKLKKKKISIIVTLEKSDFNYLELEVDYSRENEMEKQLKSVLDPNYKYVIKNSQIEYSSGYVFDKHIDIKKTDLTLKIPEKLVVREYNPWFEFDEL